MADTKDGRDKKARDEEKRQRKRELEEERERADELEPPEDEADTPPTEPADDDDDQLKVDQSERDDRDQIRESPDQDSPFGDVDALLEDRDYPVSAAELVEDHGEQQIAAADGKTSLEEVLAPEDDETFDSLEQLRERIEDRLERE